MGTGENNHELTRVALREEVEKTLSDVLPTSLPAEKKQTAVSRVEQIIERYSSPYPDPVFLAHINDIVPGSAREILDASLEHLRHQQSIEKGQQAIQNRQIDLVKDLTEGELLSTRQGRTLGFLAYLSCLVFAAGAAYFGYEWLAGLSFTVAALGVIIQIIRGGKSAVSVTTDVGVAKSTPEPSQQKSTPTSLRKKRR